MLKITPPPPAVAGCRWPVPNPNRHLWWLPLAGEIWAWMAERCPAALARIPDPQDHFGSLDYELEEQAEKLGVRPLEYAQGRVMLAARPPAETAFLVWDRRWEAEIEVDIPVGPVVRPWWEPQETDPLPTDMEEIAKAITDWLWTMPEEHHLFGDPTVPISLMLMTPNQAQWVLDRMTPLLRHLIWDLAARRARTLHPDDPAYRELRRYPNPARLWPPPTTAPRRG